MSLQRYDGGFCIDEDGEFEDGPDEDHGVFDSNPDKLEITSQEDAKREFIKLSKAAIDLHTQVKAGRKSTEEIEGGLKSIAADLSKVKKELTALNIAEVQNRAAPLEQGEKFMKQCIIDDGEERPISKGASVHKGVIWKGGKTADGEWVEGILDSEPESKWQEKMQDLVTLRTLARTIRRGKYPGQPGETPTIDRKIRRHLKSAPDFIKQRIFGDGTNIGAEWIPDQHVPTLERELRMARRVMALFQEVPMSDKNLVFPFLTTELQPYLKGTHTTDDPAQHRSSSLVTDKTPRTAVGMAVRNQVDEDAAEDSIIDTFGVTRAEIVQAIIDGLEDSIINGDSAGTHQDDIANWDPRSRWAGAKGGSDDHRRSWVGLRAKAFDRSSTRDGNAEQDYDGYLTAKALMASPHGVEGDNILLTSQEYYCKKILGFAEVRTLDKVGPQATILTGQVAVIAGSPVILSDFMTADLAATGLFTGAGALSSYLIFNRARYKMGVRRGTMVEVDKDITRGLFNFVSTWRGLFFDMDEATGRKNLVYVYNVAD